MYYQIVFFFFFSSRRRHTRYWRDWSSDVCSSDLHLLEAEREAVLLGPGAGVGEADRAVEVAGGVDLDDPEAGVLGVLGADPAVARAAQLDRGLAQQRRGPGPVEALHRAPALRVAI